MKFEISRRIYGLLLWILPRDIRKANKAELEHAFVEHLAYARERSGWIGAGFVWCRCGLDVIRYRVWAATSASRRRANRKRAYRNQYRKDTLRLGNNMANTLHDLRVSVRTLLRTPAFTAIAILTLALGIGANTAIYSLLDTVILSPLPFPDADRLISVSHRGVGPGLANMGQTAAWHFTYEDEGRAFEDLGMYGVGSAPITGVGDPEAVQAMYLTSGTFRALRVNPVLGRSITPADEELGAAAVVLLSQGYWQTSFGGSADVLGQTIDVNGNAAEIVGVMPSTLRSLGSDPSIFIPLQYDRTQLFVGNTGWSAVARLKNGVTIEQASADIVRMLPMAFEKFPGGPVIDTMREAQLAPVLTPFKDSIVGSASNLLWVLMAGVGVVLLIACANVANLFLVRAEGKGAEMAVRTAMGASSKRIGWEYLKESLVLGAVGGIGGVALAHFGLRALVAAGPGRLPRLDEVALNPKILLFALIVSLGSGLFFGLIPVLRGERCGLVDALRQGGSGGMSGRDRNRTRNALAVSQMALALLLLVGSGLMLRTSQAIRNVDPGFHGEDDLLAFRLTIPGADARGADAIAAAHEAIARRLSEVPGVTGVALANSIPMDGSGNVNPFYAEGVTPVDAPSGSRRHKWIGEGYFETMQIPLILGRSFTWADIHDRIPAAVVSERLAIEYWGSAEAAIGKMVAARPDPPQWREVIGVAADVREQGMNQQPPVLVYWPQVTLAFWQDMAADQPNSWRSMSYAVRSNRVGTADFLQVIREAVWSVNPNLPVRGLRTMPDLMAGSVARTSFTLVLLGIAAAVALLLGLIGVYGVISYTVSQRSRELGMRMALGAQAADLKKMVLRQGLVIAGVGIALGLGLAFGLTRLMTALLYGVNPVDPVTFSLVPSGLLAVVMLACYIPARRAAKVDPMKALRQE